MKKIAFLITTLLLSSYCAWAQLNEVFRIDYQVVNHEDTESTNILMPVWVNQDYFRVDNSKFTGLIYITHRAENVSFALLPDTEEYVLYPEDEEPLTKEDLPIKLIPGKEKTIAGYTCKLAELRIDYGIEGAEETVINMWYTEAIPTFYWADFQFFKLLDGAVLALEFDGLHLEAKNISQETVDNKYFEAPESYTEITGDNYEDETSYKLSEDRFMYTDDEATYYGLADAEGNKITELLYTHIYTFSQDGIAVVTDKAYISGAIDKNGKILIPFQYDYLAYDEASQQFLFSKNDKFGILDKNGKVFIPAKYDLLSFFNHGLAIFTVGDKTGLLDKNQKIVVPAVHEIFSAHNKTNYVVIKGEEYILYNIAQNKPIAGGFGYLSLHDDTNLILAEKDGKYGFIDEQGKTVIPFKFDYASSFMDGVSTILENEETYFINTKGERVESEQQ